MSDANDQGVEEERCPGSLKSIQQCDCLDCHGGFLDPRELFLECRSIDDIIAKLENTLDFFYHLQHNAFIAKANQETGSVRYDPPLVGDSYWVKCEGCYYPILIPRRQSPDVICGDCYKILSSIEEGMEPKYYKDLFDYVGLMFEMSSEGGRSLNEAYGFSKEFCLVHGIDFETVKARLRATGGYGDGEVMLNSQFNIPLLDPR
ncbi:MAG: hypothetical protein ACXADD_13785 [Candidatus Thorarchaeota archaeon]